MLLVRRPEQFDECSNSYVGCTSDNGIDECCPLGVAMWTSYEFRVSSGEGGVARTTGPVAVLISDSVFNANDAAKGASLSITTAAVV